MMFTKKLETMIKSDLPIMDALQLARRQAVQPGLMKVTKSLIDDLNQGNSLAMVSANSLNTLMTHILTWSERGRAVVLFLNF